MPRIKDEDIGSLWAEHYPKRKAMLEPFTWGVNLLFSITAAYIVIIVGRRLFR